MKAKQEKPTPATNASKKEGQISKKGEEEKEKEKEPAKEKAKSKEGISNQIIIQYHQTLERDALIPLFPHLLYIHLFLLYPAPAKSSEVEESNIPQQQENQQGKKNVSPSKSKIAVASKTIVL